MKLWFLLRSLCLVKLSRRRCLSFVSVYHSFTFQYTIFFPPKNPIFFFLGAQRCWCCFCSPIFSLILDCGLFFFGLLRPVGPVKESPFSESKREDARAWVTRPMFPFNEIPMPKSAASPFHGVFARCLVLTENRAAFGDGDVLLLYTTDWCLPAQDPGSIKRAVVYPRTQRVGGGSLSRKRYGSAKRCCWS